MKRDAAVCGDRLLAPERLSPIGYGDSHPLHPSPDARNRRVEVEELK